MAADRPRASTVRPASSSGGRTRLRLGPALLDLASAALIGVGLVCLVMPFFLYWLIHGDYDRYIWLINGPPPFDQFGGGPFQLFMYLGFLCTGAGAVSAGAALRLAPRRPEYAVAAATVAALVVGVGGLFLAIALEG